MCINKQFSSISTLEDIAFNVLRKNKVPFLTSMFIGLIAYGFVISNKLVNHDELYCLFYKGTTLESGRWGLDLISYILPNYSMPWLWGVLTLIFISIAICLIVNIFNIKSKLLQCLLAGAIICSPSLTGTFCYMFTSSAFGLAILLSVLAVYFFIKDTSLGMIIALIIMVLSLGIYQAYVSVTASLFVILLIQDVLKNESRNKDIIIKGCKYIVFLGISLAIYYIITQIILHFNGITLGAYASSKTDLEFGIAIRIAYAYYQFIKYFIFGTFGLINTTLSKAVHIICLVGIVSLIIAMRLKIKTVSQNILLIVLIALLPLSINCMYIFVNANAIHTLVVYGFVAIYVFAVMVIDMIPDTKRSLFIKKIIMLSLIIVIANNVFIANKLYLKMHMEYENMYSYYNSIMTQVKMTPGFDENSKVAFIGSAPESSYMSGFRNEEIMGFPENMKNLNKELFIHYYLGLDISFASAEEKEYLEKSESIKNMKEYPYYGSIEKIDDYIVVKLSE